MWISDDGRINTVALPKPTDVMTTDFAVASRVAWLRSKRRVRQRWINDLEESTLTEAISHESSTDERAFAGITPPRELLSGSPESLADIAGAMRDVELRWRVDAVMALIDHLDAEF